MKLTIKIFSSIIILYSLFLFIIGIRNLGPFLLAAAAMLLLFSVYTNNTALKSIIYIFFILYITFILFFAFILYKNVKYENLSGAEKSDFIVVLGSGLKYGTHLSPEGKKRSDKAIEYLKKYPHLNVFLTGGQGIDEKIPESIAMKEYFLENGIDESRIFLEDKSRSTNENIKFYIDTLKDKNIEYRNILLVTSDFHMPRAGIIAKHYNLTVYPLCSKTRNISFIPNIMREELAYIKTYFFDLK
ncbi:YdcF family protein [Sebaldella sp. S0638]|uniref:YdcF family protein n=1 Tax=Sebaldella sp. S0638 TaxID=2957809 RepID=UPI00209F4A0A|nr:YdcF family protein [Sebaldella sp. S0638]MCP1224952.1 YdcF family protein [Sebaldella sp. S0638]